MLARSLVDEIASLLIQGELSQRQIAIRLGVSRGTVSAIARGDRVLNGKEATNGQSAMLGGSSPKRCPRCGYRIYIPCLVCRTRQHREREKTLRRIASFDRHSCS
jgi:hypothetical protein